MLYYAIALFIMAFLAVCVVRLLSKKAAKICAVMGFPLLIYAVFLEPRWVKTTSLEIPIAGLERPIKAVVIGDPQPTQLHFSQASIKRIIERAQAFKPDIVLWVGDYAYQPSLFKKVRWLPDPVFFDPAVTIKEMARLTAPMGAYAVLGNHDWWWDGPEVMRLLDDTPITVLLDEAVLAQHPQNDVALWIAGLEDVSTPRITNPQKVVAITDTSAPVIALTHSPDVLTRMPETVAYTFAGHTHCGQIGIPGLQQRAAPIRNKDYACGFVSGPKGQKMYVTSGIGIGGLPVRFLARPEIVLITFVPDVP